MTTKISTELEREIEKTRRWRISKSMKPATDTSSLCSVPESGLQQIEQWAAKLKIENATLAEELAIHKDLKECNDEIIDRLREIESEFMGMCNLMIGHGNRATKWRKVAESHERALGMSRYDPGVPAAISDARVEASKLLREAQQIDRKMSCSHVIDTGAEPYCLLCGIDAEQLARESWLSRLSNALRTQDNRITQAPLFCVQQERRT